MLKVRSVPLSNWKPDVDGYEGTTGGLALDNDMDGKDGTDSVSHKEMRMWQAQWMNQLA